MKKKKPKCKEHGPFRYINADTRKCKKCGTIQRREMSIRAIIGG